MGARREEGELYDVILVELGPRKINVIKAVREILGLGLGEAMHFVENLPQTAKRRVPDDEARWIRQAFHRADAFVEVRPSPPT